MRRYSDFVWLGDCLMKRYPFRCQLSPPPKRVGGTFPPLSLSPLRRLLPPWSLFPQQSTKRSLPSLPDIPFLFLSFLAFPSRRHLSRTTPARSNPVHKLYRQPPDAQIGPSRLDLPLRTQLARVLAKELSGHQPGRGEDGGKSERTGGDGDAE
jgi:hypothetical protein